MVRFRPLLAFFAALWSGGSVFAALTIEESGGKFTLALPDYADMSGVSWLESDTFYVVRDGGAMFADGCAVHKMTVKRDAQGALVEKPEMGPGVVLKGAHDVEGVARDPFNGKIWVSDEQDTSIREYDPETGERTGRTVPVPSFVREHARGNLSLESLAISPDGLTLWTANEEALDCDGPRATAKRGTTVRLMRFTRPDGQSEWVPAGMWAYVCDPVGSLGALNSGVSDLCVLPDDSLLVLERECSYETLGLTRIYRPDFTKATDVGAIQSLEGAVYAPVEKGAALYSLRDGDFFGGGVLQSDVACYEGLCTGPRNANGTLSLLLVSDGGATASRTKWGLTATVRTQPYVRTLALRGMDGRGRTVPALAQAFFGPLPPLEGRFGLGGFGRGGVRASGPAGKSRGELYGAEAAWRQRLLESGAYGLHLGFGGAFCPRQEYAAADRLAYGEIRAMLVPERRFTDNFALGMRLGVAFNWLNARTAAVADDTAFSAQGILGVQATYDLTDRMGVYSGFDWRLGGPASYGPAGDKTEVDLSGWLWNTGVFFTF